MTKPVLWGTISACALIIVAGTVVLYHSGREAFLVRVRDEISGIAVLKMQRISAWYRDEVNDTRFIAEDSNLLQDIHGTLHGGASAKHRLRHHFTNLRKEHGYSDVVLLDSRQNFITSASDGVPGKDERKRWTRAIDESDDSVIVTPLYRRPPDSLIGIDFIDRISNEDMTPVAYLIFEADYDADVQALVEFWPSASHSAETFLLQRDGDHALYLNNLRYRPGSALTFRMPLSRREVPGVRAVLGDSGIVEGTDYRGRDVIAYVGPIQGTPWVMTAKIDAEEVFSPLRIRVIVGAVFALLLSILVGLAFKLAQSRKELSTYRSLYDTERMLEHARSFFRTTVYSMPDGVIITDPAGVVTQMNPAAESMTGWEESEAIGQPLTAVFNIIDEDHRGITESPVDTILREGVVVGLANHTLLLQRDGQEIPIADSGAPIRDVDGTLIGIVLVFRDQSDERAIVRSLEENEEKYRSLVEFSADAVLINQGGRFVYCNPAALTLYGADVESELLGKSPFDIFHPDDHDTIRTRIKILMETGVPRVRQHFRIILLDGNIIDVEVSATQFHYRGEAAIQVVVRDITERLASRRKIDEALAAAEQANRVKSLFLTNISHELRTPLNNILGYNALIRENCPHSSEPEFDEFFDAIELSSNRLLRTMHSILEIARIQSGTYERLHMDFELVAALSPVVAQYRDTARQRALSFVFISELPEVTVHGDVESVLIAVGHLIDNAVKFTEQGIVRMQLSGSDGSAELTISDSGIGMSTEYIAKLREPFSQESEGFTKKYQGIGLGMSIAIHHLEANNVTWQVRSELGKGTSFHLRFS